MAIRKDDKEPVIKPTPYEKKRDRALRLSRDIGRHMIYGGIGKTIESVKDEMPSEKQETSQSDQPREPKDRDRNGPGRL